jgi:uncharacterized repeat protein (TIGR01451 family)
LLAPGLAAYAQVCGTPGNDGPAGTISGVINTYYPGASTASAGATSISVGLPTGAITTIATGDLLLVMQMQDASINSTSTSSYGDGAAGLPVSGTTNLNNSGKFEFVTATGPVSGSAVPIRGNGSGNGLINTYTNANYISTQGQRRFQVIRVPQYSSATLGSGLTAAPWNGSTGGVLAFDATGLLNLGSASVHLDGMGFRGGGAQQFVGDKGGSSNDYATAATKSYNGAKGEGIAGTPRYIYDPTSGVVTDTGIEGYPGGSMARGAPGNAGGGGTDGDPTNNDENSGGGGGGNGGAGGIGGNTWNSNFAVGGYGGGALAGAATRMYMGGGGGAGSRNNSAGVQSSGGAGGGIVLIRAGTVTGSATITANGVDGQGADNDGGGGGGAGGSIMVIANAGGLGGLSASANGGSGGDAWPTQTPSGTPGNRHGPGGGGGGGFIALSSGSGSVAGGANGITTTVSDSYGSAAGNAGTNINVTNTQIPGANSGAQCVPSLTTTKTTSTASVSNSSTGVNATYTIQVVNATGRSPAQNVSISDTLPANFTFSSTTSVTFTGGATMPSTVNPAVGDAIPNWGVFLIPAGGSVKIVFVVKLASSVASGTYQNPATATYTDPARTVASGTATSSYDPASSTGEDVTVVGTPNLVLLKSVSPAGAQVPGTDLTYTIAFTNSGGRAAVNLVISDPIPAATDFKLGSASTTLGTTGLTVVIAYSKDSGTTWTYTPVNAAGGAPIGYDRLVTNVRWTFTGNLSQTSPNNTGSVAFAVRIR